MTDHANTQAIRRICDKSVEVCAEAMFSAGASVPQIIDRLVTYAAAQTVVLEGKAGAADVFRRVADTIERGAFDPVGGAGAQH